MKDVRREQNTELCNTTPSDVFLILTVSNFLRQNYRKKDEKFAALTSDVSYVFIASRFREFKGKRHNDHDAFNYNENMEMRPNRKCEVNVSKQLASQSNLYVLLDLYLALFRTPLSWKTTWKVGNGKTSCIWSNQKQLKVLNIASMIFQLKLVNSYLGKAVRYQF